MNKELLRIMTLPIVAIVGRPNVGKSSLFNSLVGRRVSIVEPTPGVTRDRVGAVCDIEETFFELVDTGGYGIVDRDDLSDHVVRQIHFAVDRAELILFVVDARDGLLSLDRETAEMLRKQETRVRLIANKVDEPHMVGACGEFARLGFGDPIAVSAVNGSGLRELRELIRDAVKSATVQAPAEAVMKIAIVGKRNAGKSSFVNALAGEERMIVSEIPGTTRDSVDVSFEKDGRTFVAIDTAGVRKKSKLADDIEFFAYTRVLQSIERADVVLLLIDSTVPVGQVDKKLADLITESLKPCIVVVNKWDLAKDRTSTGVYGEYLTKVIPHLSFAPVAFTTATEARNIWAVIDVASSLFKQARTRVGTGQLNQALNDSLAAHSPSAKRGKRMLKCFYATQVSTEPPTIVVFVNHTDLIDQSYERFLINRFRETLPFSEIPIRLTFRARREREATV